MNGTISDYGAVFGRWRTWFLMGNQDIHMRYRRSLLGPFWISLSMAVMVLGMALLYGRIFQQEFHEFLYWLSCSFLLWFFVSGMISDGMQIAIEAESQLRSVPIPLPVLAARMVHRNVVIFLHNAVVIAALMVLFGHTLSAVTLMALPGIAVLIGVGFFRGYRPGLGVIGAGFGGYCFFVVFPSLFWTTSVATKAPVDVVFVLDVTGSMQPEMDAVKDGINLFASVLFSRGLDSRIAVIPYRDQFDAEHKRLFTFALELEHELVTLRAAVQGKGIKFKRPAIAKGGPDAKAAVVGRQQSYMDGKKVTALVYDRAKLKAGNKVKGPAIVMEMDSTSVILPKHHGRVDKHGNILIYPDKQ